MKREELEKLCNDFVTIANKVERNHCKNEWKFVFYKWNTKVEDWCISIDQGGYVEIFIDLIDFADRGVVTVNDYTVKSIAEIESFLFRKLVERSSNISDY